MYSIRPPSVVLLTTCILPDTPGRELQRLSTKECLRSAIAATPRFDLFNFQLKVYDDVLSLLNSPPLARSLEDLASSLSLLTLSTVVAFVEKFQPPGGLTHLPYLPNNPRLVRHLLKDVV
jgi:hypothetical protein